jgi:hypothetical protein
MVTAAEAEEYLAMIREKVCRYCPERPAGGPPCLPLGKKCGVELHLPELIDVIHQVHSGLIAPYIENNQNKICAHCALRHHSECPCPMERLAVLVVEAVEAVDDERQRRARVERLLAGRPLDDGSSAEVIAPAENAGSPPADNGRPADQEDVYLVLIRNPADSPQVFERPLVRCYSYAEANRIRRELRELGYESVARQVGLGTAAD